jgi:galactose mutarotase-like enzyme
MVGTLPIQLSTGRVRASVRPQEGGVLEQLLVDDRPALARTPWADAVVPGAEPAASEAAWVARWRGGWQLCFPSTGMPDGDDVVPQGFHGAASQGPWSVAEVADDRATLRWEDALGLAAERTWRLTADGIEAVTSARNVGAAPRRIAVAEHLVLGSDTLAPLFHGERLALEVPAGFRLAPLDYAGRPAGPPVAWPGSPGDRWDTVDVTTPARVCALVGEDETPGPRRVTVRGSHVEASVSWSGLPHLLLWEELGASSEPPWNGAVVALGVEPTSTPHGAGTGAGQGIVTLAPGARRTWRTALAVRWMTA